MNGDKQIMKDEFLSLQLPHVFKNNKSVCEFLHREYHKHKNSIIATEKVLSQYCEWHKQGHKYIITSVYEVVKQRQDDRTNNKGGNNNKYADDIDQLVLFLLYSNHYIDESITFWKNELHLNMPGLYDDFSNNARQIASSYNGHPEWYAWEFFATVRGMSKQIILGSFNRLKRKGLITVDKRIIVQNMNGEFCEASDEEIEKVEEIKNRLLDEYGFANLQQLIKFGKYPEYTHRYNDEIEDAGIMMMFDKYEVAQVMGQAFVDEVVISGLDHFDRVAKSLNEIIVNNTIDNAKKRRDKARQLIYDFDWGSGELEEGKKLPYTVKMMGTNMYDYVGFYEEMTDRYIRIA